MLLIWLVALVSMVSGRAAQATSTTTVATSSSSSSTTTTISATTAAAPYDQAAFSDLSGYLGEAKREGLATWGSKAASDPLSRLEVALAVAQLAKGQLMVPPAGYALPCTDAPGSAQSDLALLAYNGVVGGVTASSFDPDAERFRGQACQMVALVLDPRFREDESEVTTP